MKGSPQPLITWFVNGMEILPSEKYSMDYEKTKAVLAINDTNAKDSGEYTCMAENDLGMQTSSYYLHVRGKNWCNLFVCYISLTVWLECSVNDLNHYA